MCTDLRLSGCCLVLIDTWWNVNLWKFINVLLWVCVLIDTWWNVNTLNVLIHALVQKRFNRYMVECELVIEYAVICVSQVLIDTWWNVNFI